MRFDIKFHFRTGSAHKRLRIFQFMCIGSSWTGWRLLSWWWNIQNLWTGFIDLLKRDQSFYYYFFTLPSSGSGILITDTFWHKLHVGTGSAHKWPKILQFLCIDDSWTCLKSLSWWWNTYNLQQRTSYCIQSGQSSGLSMGGKFDKRESTWHEFAFLWALRLLRCCHGGPEQSVRFTPTAKNATPQLQQDTRI